MKLHDAVQNGDLKRVEELVSSGIRLDAFDSLGKTPLHYAVLNERIDIAELLIRAGANVNAHDPRVIGDTPLGEVAGACSLEIATLLLEAGADPTIRGGMQLCALDRAKDRTRGDGPTIYKLLLKAAGHA